MKLNSDGMCQMHFKWLRTFYKRNVFQRLGCLFSSLRGMWENILYS